MFDIGMGEMLMLAIVAIIVVGPKDLPKMLRTIGKVVGQLKRQANEFKSQFDDAIRETEISEIQSSLDGVVKDSPVTDFEKAIKDDFDEIEESFRKKAMAADEAADELDRSGGGMDDDFPDDDGVSSDNDYPDLDDDTAGETEVAAKPASASKQKSSKSPAQSTSAAKTAASSKPANENAA